MRSKSAYGAREIHMMKIDVEPPKTLSGAIELAVADARSLDRTDYCPSSVRWHVPTRTGCRFCLAGAVIAGTLSFDRHRLVDPTMMSLLKTVEANKWRLILLALDNVRKGFWGLAWTRMYAKSDGVAAQIPFELRCLPKPENTDFIEWPAFEQHLESLEAVLPALREIEEKYGC